ncbi:MAG: DUF167 domain-containing protein, partial [Chloroflexi bacterium]|nr:DUF167 domain-containing protein [Chloroflexota bacterium]
VGGKANEELIRFLSELFNIPQARFEIVMGSTNRNKLVAIEGIDAESLQNLILEIVN